MSADEQTVREFLKEQLTALLPAEWRVIDHQALPDSIDRTTVLIKLKRITKNPKAPRASLVNEAVIVVACPLTDTGMAEAQLDDDVLALCMALNKHDRIVWEEAERTAVSSAYAGWDVSIKVLSSIKPTENPEAEEE